MASFKANGKKMEQLPSDFRECESSLNQSAEELSEVVNALSTLSGMYYVTNVLQKRRENIQAYARGINVLGDGMQQIAQLYVSTENRILENGGVIPHTPPSRPGGGRGRGEGREKDGEDWLDFIPEGIESPQDLYDWLDRSYDGLSAAQKAALLAALNVLMPGSSLLVLGMMDDGFWGDTLRQVILGEFAEEETWLGTALNIAIGYGVYFIPYVGPIIGLALDARDLAGSGYKVYKEGWTTENTLNLILNGIAAIPGADAIKALKGLTATADAASPIAKNADTILDILKKADSSKVTEVLRNVEEFFGKNPLAETGQKLVNKVMDIKGLEKMKEGVKTFMDKNLFDPGSFTENTGKWGEVIETAYQDGIDEFIGCSVEDITGSVLDKLSEWKADIQEKVQGQQYGFA